MKIRVGFRGGASVVAVCIAAAGLLGVGAASAQQVKYPASGPKLPQWTALPDWNGLWERGGDIVWNDKFPFKAGEPELPPYNDSYLKEYLARRAEMRADALAGRPRTFKGAGLYGSMPAMMIMLFPMDIQINPREVVIMSANGGGPREIYTDGRVHPDGTLPSSKGHSIGHWEGKTLVVDTCCFREDTRLPGGGAHSDQMHVTERLWAPDARTLKDAITVEDPKAFTKPWTTEKTYYRRLDWEQVEYDEGENARDFDKPSPDGEATFGAPPADGGSTFGAPPKADGASPSPAARPLGKPATTEGLQKATALAVGNLAWETVVVAEVKRGADKITWNGVTRSVTWHCTAASDGTGAFCEQPPSAGANGPPGGRPAMAAAAEPAAPRASAAPTLAKNTVTVGGQDRDYYFFVPPKADRAGFNQVVYALHDNGQTAQQFAETSGWMKVAAENGFVVVFPETVQKDWGPSAGGEDDYLAAVLAHAGTHMLIPPPPGGGGGPRGGGGGGGRAAGAPGAAAAEGDAGRRQGPPRVRTWAPFQYLTGVGAGATLAQSFAMNHPGLYAAVATVDGAANDEAYIKSEQPADGAFLHIWPDKALVPVWKQQKKDVPVAAWLFTHGAPTAAGTRQADYWKRADHVAAAATTESAGGYQTAVFTSRDNPAQQVRTTTLPA
ncbi:hypothetical protein, partial [Phenylobacterium sp.]|uniref:hypothetical protein n=1 Tax=Phenylobacterium sp. TaxID=1871053 RepID=UPI0025D50983